jgi:hypothetical protein
MYLLESAVHELSNINLLPAPRKPKLSLKPMSDEIEREEVSAGTIVDCDIFRARKGLTSWWWCSVQCAVQRASTPLMKRSVFVDGFMPTFLDIFQNIST